MLCMRPLYHLSQGQFAQTLARARFTIPQSFTMPAAGSKRVEGEWLTPEEFAIYEAVRQLTPKEEKHGQSPKKKQKTLAPTPMPSTTLAVPAPSQLHR